MIEMTTMEALLMIWAVGASTMAGHYYGLARERDRMLRAAASLTKKLVEDDKLRDELRAAFKTADRIKFGLED